MRYITSFVFWQRQNISRRLTAALSQHDQLGGQDVAEQDEELPAADEALPDFPPKVDITRSVFFP